MALERRKDSTEAMQRLAVRQQELAERKKVVAGRENEISELEHLYQQGSFKCCFVYGPEGAGKTLLVKEFCGWKRRIIFDASKEKANGLMRFAEIVTKHYEKGRPESFASWDSVFKFIADNEQSKARMSNRLVLVLDEFPDPARRDDQFMRMLKDSIENILSQTKMLLIITSSDEEFAHKYFIDEGALLRTDVNGVISLEGTTLGDAEAKKMADEAALEIKGITNARAKMRKVEADEVIIREGETSSEMYKIISGSAVCYFKYGTENEYILASLSEGDCFGEYPLITGEPGIYTVVAFGDMLVIKITKEDLVSFIEQNAKNAIDIIGNTARMLNIMAMNFDLMRSEYEVHPAAVS